MGDDGRSKRPDREDYERALKSMGTFVDISVDDLMSLTRTAERIAQQHTKEVKRIADVMTSPVQVVHPETPLSAAARLMMTHRISGLPVVDGTGRAVGIVSETDFLRALGVPGPHASHGFWHAVKSAFTRMMARPKDQDAEASVADYMTPDVVCAGPGSDLHDVLDLMRRHRVGRVLVCDPEGRCVGVVTRADLLPVFFAPAD
ncbi:MAG: CBS domain-containing protein [Gammaproteobacteria bacterium]|nr:CBS domain-containing protein [Gammaproteobacteria bacterium]